MKKNFWNIRIPTLFGLLTITIGFAISAYLFQQNTPFITRASSSKEPSHITISNITSDSFTVSYTTNEKTPGLIRYGQDTTLQQKAIDIKDTEPGIGTFTTHFITMQNLTPTTKYFFVIDNGESIFQDNGKPYELTTAQELVSNNRPIHLLLGKILSLEQSPNNAEGIIVSLSADNGQTVSTLARLDGVYSLDISALRTKDLTTFFPFTDNTIMNMTLISPLQQSKVTLLAKQTASVPPIILSQNYDFTITTQPLQIESPQSNFPPVLPSSSEENPAISSPKKDEIIPDSKPTFDGVSQPDSEVEIIIHSDQEIRTQVKTDTTGRWLFRPTTPLSPGEHTITIITRDKNGQQKTVTQTFSVLGEGTRVIQSATPSATPITFPTNKPTAISPKVTTAVPTAVPTQIVEPTTIEIVEVLTPLPTKSFPLPTQIADPEPGSSSLLFASMLAVVTTASGVLLFLSVRGGTGTS